MRTIYRIEIKKLADVTKYLSDGEINNIMHDLAVRFSNDYNVTYHRACSILIEMLNTIKREQEVGFAQQKA